MFDIGALELLVIVIVAIIVIGPKDMPKALRLAGRWVGKMRRMSAQFRSGFDAMVREAELEEMEKEWKARNAKIMAGSPDTQMQPQSTSAEAASPARTNSDANGPENLLPASDQPSAPPDEGKA